MIPIILINTTLFIKILYDLFIFINKDNFSFLLEKEHEIKNVSNKQDLEKIYQELDLVKLRVNNKEDKRKITQLQALIEAKLRFCNFV